MKRANPMWLLFALALAIVGCQVEPVECDQECIDHWLDGSTVNDDCLDTILVKCLVSGQPAPSAGEKDSLQVIIAVHGFTASSFEWKEFHEFIDTAVEYGSVRVSRVILGGHGRDLDVFQSSTWKGWGAPILAEYDSLTSLGYKHISFACASTGCSLLMQYLSDGDFRSRPAPKWIFMIDPIVVPTVKLLSLVNIVGPILGNSPNNGTEQENLHWYVNRPQETLRELYELINVVKNRLEDGFRLPKATQAKVFKVTRDKEADPIGALLIFKGMRKSDGSHIEVQMIDSKYHVFTRLQGRTGDPSIGTSEAAVKAREQQMSAFREMGLKVLKP
jgi:carboxylesterase